MTAKYIMLGILLMTACAIMKVFVGYRDGRHHEGTFEAARDVDLMSRYNHIPRHRYV